MALAWRGKVGTRDRATQLHLCCLQQVTSPWLKQLLHLARHAGTRPSGARAWQAAWAVSHCDERDWQRQSRATRQTKHMTASEMLTTQVAVRALFRRAQPPQAGLLLRFLRHSRGVMVLPVMVKKKVPMVVCPKQHQEEAVMVAVTVVVAATVAAVVTVVATATVCVADASVLGWGRRGAAGRGAGT